MPEPLIYLQLLLVKYHTAYKNYHHLNVHMMFDTSSNTILCRIQ